MAVYRLEDDSVWFPHPGEAVAEYDGLLAVGGDYSPERLLAAYSCGIFPWPVAEGEPITWFSPDPRFVLKAENLHSKSRNTPFEGTRLYGRVCTTIKGGRITYQAQ